MQLKKFIVMAALLFFPLALFGAKRDRPSYRSMPRHTSYPGHYTSYPGGKVAPVPKYSSYGGKYKVHYEDNKVAKEVFESARCVWVREGEMGIGETDAIAAYEVNGCKQGTRPVVICTGTAECDVTMSTTSGNPVSFTMTVEDVMCTSNEPFGRCPNASVCVNQGGVLNEFSAGDIAASKSKYSPPTTDTHD